ncbi:MAG: hypothetical protein O3B76_01405 [Proteobacteria bacterium]|nr:hypothetical protein [Pseudomonadota bacterium]MDA1022267.1 hypothetical protein [Pseudomonadota bacterium]
MADHIQIGDISPRIQFTGDGTQTLFTFPFPIFKDVDLAVYEDTTPKTLTTHYTVLGAGNSAGGSATFLVAPANGVIVTLKRQLAIQRTSDFQESGEFRSKVINDELDTLTASLQQVDDDVSRSLRLGATDTAASLELPAKGARTSKFLAFDANGDPIASDGPAGGVAVSTFGATLIDDADAATARTTLGAVIGTDVLSPNGDGSGLTGIATGATDAEKANIILNAFRIAINGGLSVQNMVDGVVDEFEDETGIDTATSTNEVYDATGDYYTGSGTVIDGTWSLTDSNVDGRNFNNGTDDFVGLGFTAANSGTINSIKVNVNQFVAQADTVRAQLYTNNAGSPGSTIGSATPTQALSGTGDYTFTFGTPPSITAGTFYWMVISDPDDTNYQCDFAGVAANASFSTGAAGTAAGISDNSGQWPTEEIKMEITVAVDQNITLVSGATTALAQPTDAFIVLWQEDVDAVTLNTDLTAEVSRDGGTTWTAVTLTEEATLTTGRILTGTADISAQPAGTSMKYRIKTLNTKGQRIHGVGLQWS